MTATNQAVTIELPVSQQVDGKREQIGVIPCFTPLLEAFGLDYEVSGEKDDEGLPVYKDNAAAWLFSAVVNHAKTSARNRIKPRTAELLPGRSHVTTLDELFAPVVRSGSAALAERSGLFALWNAYMDSLNRQPAVTTLAKQFMKSPDALIAQPANVKAGVNGWLSGFIDAHGEELSEYQAGMVSTVIEACETDAASLEW